MNSFRVNAIGNLATDPELIGSGDRGYTRLCLVGSDYPARQGDDGARETLTSLWFVAFGALGEALSHEVHKGDQLILEARIRGNYWTDRQAERQYNHTFIVEGFRLGAVGSRSHNGRNPRRASECAAAGSVDMARVA